MPRPAVDLSRGRRSSTTRRSPRSARPRATSSRSRSATSRTGALDGIGGFDCYGAIENCDTATRRRSCRWVSPRAAELTRDVAIDEPITYDDVVRPAGRLVDRLRAEQDQRFGGPFSGDADRETAAKPARP